MFTAPKPTRLLAALLFCLGLPMLAQAEEFTYESLYTHYSIVKTGSIVELRHLRKSGPWLESAVDLSDPPKQVVHYTRTLFAGSFFADYPRQVLMIGLGGGGFNRLFNAAFTTATLQTVDVDSMALEVAQKHMGFATSDRNKVAIMDGRQYVRRTKEKWDWVILDAFHGGYIPFHLKTREFYEQIKKAMAPEGVLISNLHEGTMLYDSDVKTLQSCFAQVMLFEVPEAGNIIAIAVKYDSPKLTEKLEKYQTGLANATLRKYLDLESIKKSVILRPDQKQAKGEVLTDDYCPVEYLNAQDK